MAYVKKTQKAKNAVNDARYLAAVKRSNIHFKKREYLEDKEGNRVRVWGDCDHDFVTDADVKTWLKGNRVIEDLRSGLEYVREGYIKMMVREDYLRYMHGYYWITQKAADRWHLEKVLGCKFPK
jgi:hypothetical protein